MIEREGIVPFVWQSSLKKGGSQIILSAVAFISAIQ